MEKKENKAAAILGTVDESQITGNTTTEGQ